MKLKDLAQAICERRDDDDDDIIDVGDIVKFKDGPYYREGYFRIGEVTNVDGGKVWVGGLDDNRGWYIDPDRLIKVITSAGGRTERLRSTEDVEDYLDR